MAELRPSTPVAGPSPLHHMADAAGLQRLWQDADGNWHEASDATLATVLARLTDDRRAKTFIASRANAKVILPAGISGPARLELANGSVSDVIVGDDRTLPMVSMVGYHNLEIAGSRYTLAVAPERCPSPVRCWGATVQIPSLRSAKPTSHGDFAALGEAVVAFGEAGADMVAISPTHALFPGDPARCSPYSPSSRLFHNVLLASPFGDEQPASDYPNSKLIDWPRAATERLGWLRVSFDGRRESLQPILAAFRADRGEALVLHACFDALHTLLGGKGWQDWPAAHREPDGRMVREFAAANARDVDFYIYLQWLADRGLERANKLAQETMRIGIISDLAVGVDPNGSQVWSRRQDFLEGLSIGAPPDSFGPAGQDWGLTAFNPTALESADYLPFRAVLQSALRHASGVRIDHALGLDRLWVIPEGASASEGVYLRMPSEDLKAVIAIEAHLAGAIVIAEDLGTVPPGLREDLSDRGMLGMRVLPFERNAEGSFIPPSMWDENAVAMSGTHDTPTLAGWWSGRDIDWRIAVSDTKDDPSELRASRDRECQSLWRSLGREDPPPIEPPIDAVLESIATAPSLLCLIPFEDLVGALAQPNLPGTIDEHPNWRRRMAGPTDALLLESRVAARTFSLTALRGNRHGEDAQPSSDLPRKAD